MFIDLLNIIHIFLEKWFLYSSEKIIFIKIAKNFVEEC